MGNVTRPAAPVREDDELRILRWIADHGAATLGEIRDQFAARMGRVRARRGAERLRKAGQLDLVDAKYTITNAGRERAAVPRSKLPVLPSPLTPHGGFLCTRLGIALTVEQCVSRHVARGGDVCGRDADGKATKEGCPVGAEAARGLVAYRERKARAA